MTEHIYGDKVMGDKVMGDKVAGNKVVRTGFHPSRPPHPANPPVILLMSANPAGTSPLHLDKERRAIHGATAHAVAAGQVAIRSADALRRHELPGALVRHRPAIAHFSGHGTGSDGLLLLDRFDRPQSVRPAALAELFGILSDPPQAVVLNACLTYEQAKAIAAWVPCVVGMDGRIADAAAIRFAAGFYLGVANGRSIREAYDLGCNQLAVEEFPDARKPVLFAAPRVAEQTVIVPNPRVH